MCLFNKLFNTWLTCKVLFKNTLCFFYSYT
ncbi:hypothetical protein [Enterococcus phage MDA2]|uniref:Uncharacterized protein n=1 Tax=Enterococcus phage MDA2 TaxID=2816459 RepID=A0AAE7RFS9_9CAUD|nr:hypothetical protein [Enterococcus phage MDA2]